VRASKEAGTGPVFGGAATATTQTGKRR